MRLASVMLFLATFLAAVIACSQRDLSDDLWFFADFDGPAVIDGFALPHELPREGFRDGRFGSGYSFHRSVRNVLPPTGEFLRASTNFSAAAGASLRAKGDVLKFSGGKFSVRPVPTGIVCGYLGATGLVCSFYVRGRAGGHVSLLARLSPVDAAVEARALKKKQWGFPGNRIADSFKAADYTLSGGWERVWCVAIGDNRVSEGRQVVLEVESDCALEMKKFQYEPAGEYPTIGFYHPGIWCEGGEVRPSNQIVCSDAERLAGFPWKEGSFSCWIRTDPDETPMTRAPALWGMNPKWAESWGCNGNYLRTSRNNARGLTHFGCKHIRSADWRHVAMTWRGGDTVVYVDGREVRRDSGREFQEVVPGSCTLRIGAYNEGAPADATMDDVAIFRRSLAPEEVEALASGRTRPMGTSRGVVATKPPFLVFHRNQRDAAIRCVLHSSSAGEFVATAKVGSVQAGPRTVHLKAGRNYFAMPFEPSLLDVGTYPYVVRLSGADGGTALELSGRLEVRGRLERDAWKYHSWGGPKGCSLPFLRECGFNAVNIMLSGESDVWRVRRLVEAGFFVNIRYENSSDWRVLDLDEEKIALKARRTLWPFAGLHSWTSTLLNSEVYGAATSRQAMRHPKFLERVRKALHAEPSWNFGTGPVQLLFGGSEGRTAGPKPFRGAFDIAENRDLMTLSWFMDRGSPIFDVNRATAAAVKRLSPGNCVWTEPIVGQGGIVEGVDLMADWLYSYGTRTLLFEQREQYGRIRGVRTAMHYAPTLSFSAFMNGLNPEKTGENGDPQGVRLCHSADEMSIRSWIALGATRHDALSLYAADSWEQGISNGTAEASWPSRHGRFIQEEYLPAAMLLRGMENVRAPYAVLVPSEVQYAANVGWAPYHYLRIILSVLAKRPVPFDVLTDYEIKADVLRKYSYVIFPLSFCLTKDHAAAVAAASAAGTTIVCDASGAWLKKTCPRFVHLERMSYSGISEKAKASVAAELEGWFSGVERGLSARLGAFSDKDDSDSFTFEKGYGGVRYVLVANDARSSERCILNTFKTNSWYKPLGAASRISTTIKAPRGSWACQYAADGREARISCVDGRIDADGEYAPASAKVFAVYPRRLAGMSVRPDSMRVRPGSALTLDAEVSQTGRGRAPGRQVMRLRVTDANGRQRDESGLYVLEGGHASVPVRLPLDAAPGEWRFEARELTTGFSASGAFHVVH